MSKKDESIKKAYDILNDRVFKTYETLRDKVDGLEYIIAQAMDYLEEAMNEEK